jgi:hypothetical protein
MRIGTWTVNDVTKLHDKSSQNVTDQEHLSRPDLSE